jgi:hypothetical protein
MDDGAFDQNFTWFEWGFVNPEDMPRHDARAQTEANGHWPAVHLGETQRVPPGLQLWDEDHRWPT